MKFVLANWGTRGEIEPFVAIGRELVNRGHEVHIAVAPEMVFFAEAAGPVAVPYGPTLKETLDPHRDFWVVLFSTPWKIRRLGSLLADVAIPMRRERPNVRQTLMALTHDADVLFTGMNYEDVAANVAESCGVELATLQIFPLRANGRLLSFLPPSWGRRLMELSESLSWRGDRKTDDQAERLELGLPRATGPWQDRIADRDTVEIQAYDAVLYPSLAEDWAKWGNRRPFVGAVTLALPTDSDAETAAWIAAGTPPICFSFGSVGVESSGATFDMISSACAALGERALICAAGSDFVGIECPPHVKVVGLMNYAETLPSCRAFAHHGGAGTTNAGLRAGLPTLILWTLPDQGLWSARVKRLKVGTGRRFSASTTKKLVKDLRRILAPSYAQRARDIASRMTTAAESVTASAEILEAVARRTGSR